MKTIMLMAGAILLPFLNPTSKAQNEKLEADTLIVKLKGNNQILFTGKTLRELKDYETKADEVKTNFAIDVSKAYTNNSLSKTATEVHYFYNSPSQRRIKAEQAEYSDRRVDIEYEKNRMRLNLPRHKYTIHDIVNNHTWEIYFSNPDSLLSQIGEISMKEALATLEKDKKLLTKQTNITINTDSNLYKVSYTKTPLLKSLELTAFIGASIIGNRVSPSYGITATYVHRNKYRIPEYKIGLTQSVLHFIDVTPTDISNNSIIFAYDIFYVKNINIRSKNKVLGYGIQVGQTLGYPKFGFVVEGVGLTNWSLDLINTSGKYFTRNQQILLSLSMRLPF